MKEALLLILAPGLFLTTSLTAQPGRAERPNILFIVSDDLNDWIGPLGGHPDTRTPHLDRLASEGLVFTRAYTAAPSCNPSRVAVMTGIRPSTSGVYENNQLWRPVLPEAVTLAQLFQDHGYRVLGAGKIFHTLFYYRREQKLVHSFERAGWDEFLERGEDPMPPNRPLNRIQGTAFFDWGPVEVPDEQMDDYKMVSWAIRQLDGPHQRPFFLACGIFRPHQPFFVPPRYFEMFPLDEITLPLIREDDLEDVPPPGVAMARPQGAHKRVMESGNFRRAVQGYLASIAFADAQVGRLLDALEKSSYSANTIVVFWGDHGFHLGEKQHWTKFTLWEESVRAPLIVKVPGLTRAGERSSRTVSFVDIYPTLADLAGLPIPKAVEGVSLRPLLEDPEREWNRPALTTHGRSNHSLRSERWHYIRYADGSEELYDQEADPMEWKNLAAEARLLSVKRDLARWLPEVNAPAAPSTLR